MRVTKKFGLLLLGIAASGCAHRPERPAPEEAAAIYERHRAAMASERAAAVKRTGHEAFDERVVALATSEDPMDRLVAQLLPDLVARAQPDAESPGPLIIAFVEPTSPWIRTLTSAIETALRAHPQFRISDRRAIERIKGSKEEEHSGHFDDATVESVGAFHGAGAIGRVTVDRASGRSVVTVRLTSTRTLLVIADARTATDLPIPADAAIETSRIAPATHELRSPPAACVEDPKSKACARARLLQTAREIADRYGAGDNPECTTADGRGLPPICCKDPDLPACREP